MAGPGMRHFALLGGTVTHSTPVPRRPHGVAAPAFHCRDRAVGLDTWGCASNLATTGSGRVGGGLEGRSTRTDEINSPGDIGNAMWCARKRRASIDAQGVFAGRAPLKHPMGR